MAAPIHHEVDFKASPKRVYEALTDAKQFSAFSGLPAAMWSDDVNSMVRFELKA